MSVIVGRSRIATKYGIVAASQPLAARAGVQVLERGGNAIDAAIATNAVMGLVEPQSNGIGGDLFAIVYEAKTGRLHGSNSHGWAPRGLTPALLKSLRLTEMPSSGIHTVTVPGAVAGWDALRARSARSDVRSPRTGDLLRGRRLPGLGRDRRALGRADGETRVGSPAPRRRNSPNGRAPLAGDVFRNPGLAGSLRLIANHGPAGFYEGRTADAILAISHEKGGTMTAADLREFEPEWVDPISTTYRGWTVYELPPNTQGIAALMMLNLMEQFPLGEYGFHSARALHVMIEAKKLAYADMLRYVADMRTSQAPVSAMLDKAHAKRRARRIGAGDAARDVQPSVFDGLTNSSGTDTIYLAVIDKHGNIVSLIQSIYEGFGSAIVPPGTGFALHNRGALFTLDETHPNALAPRKRPLHTIIPGFMQRGDTRIGFGIMGGFNQAQAHAQFVANIVDYGMDIQQALEAGRFTKATFAGADVNVEALVPESVRDELTALGHEVTAIPPRTGTFGHGQGGDERRFRRAFRRVGAAARRRGDS